MTARTAHTDWQEPLVLDEHTVQLRAGDQTVRIIGPAQQTLRRLREHPDSTTSPEAETESDAEDETDDDGAPPADQAIRVRARRQLAAVLLDGLPRPAALLAEQLTDLHLGLLLLRDDHPVDRADLAAGYPAAAVGLTRAAAVRRACLRQNPEAAVVCAAPTPDAWPADTVPTPDAAAPRHLQAAPPQEPVDIQVIFAQRAVAPARLAAAASRAQLVLPVVQHPAHWQIGPLLSRDRGPCPRCLLLHGTAADPHFEAVQTALAEQGAAQDQITDRPVPSDEPQSAMVLASLVAREIQLAVDGEFTPQTASRMIGLALRTGELSLVPVTPHPECDCRLHTATAR